jgi:histone-lysine N-methyltransferase SETD2
MEEEERARDIQRRVRAIQEKQPQEPFAAEKKTLPYVTNSDRWAIQAREQAKIQAIITSVAEARASAEAAAAAEAAELKAKEELAAMKVAKKKEEKEKKQRKQTEESKAVKEANKEKRLLKLVGAAVVKSMSKYAKGLGKDEFKKHAKEVSLMFHCL